MIGDIRFDYRETTSTSDEARSAIGQGAPSGSVFVAEYQTAGRGRRGASWSAAAGESVLMTVLLYPSTDIADAWKLGWVASTAVIEALSAIGLVTGCKWPNDVIVGSKKIAGILVETVPITGKRYGALVGIGINVLQRKFPDENTYRILPTSVAIEQPLTVPTVSQIVEELCRVFDKLYMPDGSNWEDIVDSYQRKLVLGLEQSGTDPYTGIKVSGKLAGIRESDGAARLVTGDNLDKFVIPELVGES